MEAQPNPAHTAGPLFSLGEIIGTPAALKILRQYNLHPIRLLARHLTGDWGEVSAADAAANRDAVVNKGQIRSCYVMSAGEQLWVVTTCSCNVTTILLPGEHLPIQHRSGDTHVRTMPTL